MKPHKRLFFLRHIAMGRGGMEKVVHYLDDHLPATFSHPLKTMEDCDMLSFLCRVRQVCLEFWNSSNPFEEYMCLTLQSHQDVYKMSVHTCYMSYFLFSNTSEVANIYPTLTRLKKWMSYRS